MKILTTLVLALLLTVGCSATGQVQANDDYFSQAELDSMLAPVALYPDSVLSHVLIAATYPLEVIQAARWSREHPGLRGEDAVAAVEYQDWDASVKALVAFPDLLRRMEDDLQWTQDLGDAFLIQEEDVIASIQYLRSEAYSQGHLRSNDHVKVVREREYIYIEPARTRVVYVPYYDPRIIYTRWRWSSHPPRYWHRPSGYSVSVNFHWGRPYHIRPSFYFSSFHWPTRKVVVVNHHHYYREHRFHSGRQVARFDHARHWKHDPRHRRGVSYRTRVEQTRFVENARPASARGSSNVGRASARASVRSDRRDWAAQRRSSMDFDRQARSRSSSTTASRTESRSNRVAESARQGSRSDSRAVTRSRGSERAAIRSDSGPTASDRLQQSRTNSRSRTSGSESPAPSRASGVRESLRSTRSSRDAAVSRSAGAERSSGIASSGASNRSITERRSRSGNERSATESSRAASLRSGGGRERSSAPSRPNRSSAPSSRQPAVISRQSAPSRRSAPSRSGARESAPARSAPRSRASAPSRSSSQPAPARSRSASPRSSKASAPSRSRGGDSRRGGGRERE